MITANTLFHCTDDISFLKSILKDNGFRPSFCIDDYKGLFYNNSEINNYAIPMVCFCDIPLSQIKDHIDKYGGYALGLSKDWGRNNKLNPVTYLAKSPNLINVYAEFIKNKLVNFKPGSDKTTEGIVRVLQYMKPYEGKKWLKKDLKFSEEDTNFYNEREWRYVPTDMKNCVIWQNEFEDSTKKSDIQNTLKDCCSLEFCATDIKYIIVKDNDQVLDFIKFINNELQFKKVECNEETKKILCSRILTTKQINDDF
jgi:hypothetical protein